MTGAGGPTNRTVPTIIVLAKRPVPGRVKTRLVPPLTFDEAARIAAAALRDTLDAVDSAAAISAAAISAAVDSAAVVSAGVDSAAVDSAAVVSAGVVSAAVDSAAVVSAGAERILAFDGDPAGWLAPGWRHAPQAAGGLDRRLAAAFAAARPGRPAVLVGMDTPQLRPAHLTAFDADRFDACLGPATDGGFWLLGFADPAHAAATVPGVLMSSPHTGAEQLARLRSQGLRVQLLDTLTDVDTVESADEVAAAAPHTAFATALGAARGVGRGAGQHAEKTAATGPRHRVRV